jgi:hypothetical protein
MAASWAGLLADLDPRLSILVAAVPSVASGIFVWWQWRGTRSDQREDREMSRDDRRARELDQQQASLGAETSRWFGDLRQENRDLRIELAETRRDRERGWDLARFWHGAAHDVLRQFRNLRHNSLNMQQWIEAASRRHPDLGVPVAIDPIPDRVDLPMGLEDTNK